VIGVRRYVVNVYFVSNDNGAGANIPSLKRLELNGPGFTETVLVEGIERLQIEYGVDADGDGGPDVYTAAPATTSDWANVVTAKVHVLARTLDMSPGHVDTKTYSMGFDSNGTAIVAGPFNDGYKRHVYSAAIRLMNPSGGRDTP
jgi:type IV pilus assembly protein PilW